MFLRELERRITRLPRSETEKSLAYYSEMIDDMTEDGMSEEAAVLQLGSMDEIVEQIMLDAPFKALFRARKKEKHTMRPWEIILLVLGSVVWVPVLLALAGLGICLLGALVGIVAAIFGIVIACAVGAVGVLCALVWWSFTTAGIAAPGIAVGVGAALILAGLTVLAFLGAVRLVKWLICLLRRLMRRLKGLIIKKEGF